LSKLNNSEVKDTQLALNSVGVDNKYQQILFVHIVKLLFLWFAHANLQDNRREDKLAGLMLKNAIVKDLGRLLNMNPAFCFVEHFLRLFFNLGQFGFKFHT